MCTIPTFTFGSSHTVFWVHFVASLSRHNPLTACVALWLIQAILTTFHFITMLLCRCCSLLAMPFSHPQYSSPKRARFSISDFLLLPLCCVAPTEKKCNNVYLCPVYSVKEWMEKLENNRIKRARFTPGVCWKIINIIKIVINYSLLAKKINNDARLWGRRRGSSVGALKARSGYKSRILRWTEKKSTSIASTKLLVTRSLSFLFCYSFVWHNMYKCATVSHCQMKR